MLKSPKDYPAMAGIDEQTLDKNSSIAHMLELVGARQHVLDVGCASGYFAKLLRARSCRTNGIEVNESAAQAAREYCERVYVADLDTSRISDVVGSEKFDVITFGDVLEHLRSPLAVLEDARGLLNENGFIVASIPNVAHGSIRLALLGGNFDYQELGILDATHLHFFTAKTVEELLVGAGYRIERIERSKLPLFAESDLVPRIWEQAFSAETVADIRGDAEHDTLQFIIKAYPLSDQAWHSDLVKRYVSANTEASHARARMARQAEELERVRQDLAQRQSELSSAHEQLAQTAARLNSVLQTNRENEHAVDEVEGLRERLREALAHQERLEKLSAATQLLLERVQEQHAHENAQYIELVRDAEERASHLAAQIDMSERTISTLQAESGENRRANRALTDSYSAEQKKVADLEAQLNALSTRLEHSEKRLERSVAERTELAARHAETLQEARAVEKQFLHHINELTARTRNEAQELATLIDVIQTSHFFQLKKFLRRVVEVLNA